MTKLISIGCIMLVAASSCQKNVNYTENFEEAKQIVLELQHIPINPPPRRSEDILELLSERSDPEKTRQLETLKSISNLLDPEYQDPANMFLFFKTRGMARYELSQLNGALQDLRQAVNYGQQINIHEPELYRILTELSLLGGDFSQAEIYSKESIEHIKTQYQYGPALAYHARTKIRLGDFESAKELIDRAKWSYSNVPKNIRYSFIYDANILNTGSENDITMAEADYLEANGEYEQAYPLRVHAVNHYSRLKEKFPLRIVQAQLSLALNLLSQNRIVEAEKEARIAITDAVNLAGRKSAITAQALGALARIRLLKRDIETAKKLSDAQLEIIKYIRLSKSEILSAESSLLRADIESTGHNFENAAKWYDSLLTSIGDNSRLREKYVRENSAMILSFLKMGRLVEAEELYIEQNKLFSTNNLYHPISAIELNVIRLILNYLKEEKEKFFLEFSLNIDILKKIMRSPEINFIDSQRIKALLDIYIDFLAEYYFKNHNASIVPIEIFKVSQIDQSQASQAVNSNNARTASLIDPELSELVRQSQDTEIRIESLNNIYLDLLASVGTRHSRELQDIAKDLNKLKHAKEIIDKNISSRYPEYTQLINPPLLTIIETQARLSPSEALLNIWTNKERTYVWCILPTKYDFIITTIGEEELKQAVQSILNSVLPRGSHLRSIPDFDMGKAFQQYVTFVQPFEPILNDTKNLFTIVKGPLDRLPFSFLPMEKEIQEIRNKSMMFEEYKNVPWLINKYSLTRLPSVAYLKKKRSVPFEQQELTFAGFGDSVFNENQIKTSENLAGVAVRGESMKAEVITRKNRMARQGSIDSASIVSLRLEDLQRLPDTADEILSIAESLDANISNDVFLRERSSEDIVKSLDLSNKKVIAFATHALHTGDVDGLEQPALAFSSPLVTEGEEDGLLTMGEVLALRFDADLIVLSACDTGSSDDRGSEAISGLGKAFFYAGAKSLLATLWPVESNSAKQITTEMFRLKKQNKTISWSEAHRKSMQNLIFESAIYDNQGNALASYAHPFFWAPFIFIGNL